MQISLPWTKFKDEVNTRDVPINYYDSSDYYYMFCFDGSLELTCKLMKDSGDDQIDFETNYKVDAVQIGA